MEEKHEMDKLQCVGLCSMGTVRKINQDNLYMNGIYKSKDEERFYRQEVQDTDGSYVYAIADGMGGLCYGEEAAYASILELKKYVDNKRNNMQGISGTSAIRCMNQAVCALGRERKATVGSTATLLRYENQKVRIYNVGDSKAFLYRNGSITQLSEDHTEKAGFLRMKKERGMMDYTFSGNGLTQYLGIEEEEFLIEPAVTETIEMQEKDIFLLCSDGLTGMVDTEQILHVMLEKSGLEVKIKKLEQMAIVAGGNDNITILLLELCGEI